ncbi:MAG: uroporphyrinogen decarboxylase [Caulobacteraceae bacterium]
MDTSPDMVVADQPRLLRAIARETMDRPPVWFMRQAGRSLPEYRQLRTRFQDFIAFCHDPESAAEATLQPLRRFPLDAAIVFADILLLPGALGQRVWFEAGEGPRLGELPSLESMEAEIEASTARLANIGETLKIVRAHLEPERTLIGFAGAPWTVATYMLQGKGGEREDARRYAFSNPEDLDRLIDILVESTARYLAMQFEAGAQVLQIFESWAELLPEDIFERIVTRPHARIIARARELGVTCPFIGFPRGCGSLVEPYARDAGVNVVGLDVTASAEIGRRLQEKVAIQGALDPLLLREGGEALDRRVDQLLEQWGPSNYIFNLGHGVIPDTPISNIERVLRRVTGQ